jgi:hypothetical protein
MPFKVGEGKFGVPAGIYRVKFLGCQLRQPQPGQQPLLGRDGQPMPPGMEWQFEVLDGEWTGKVTSRTTGQDATPKNACGRMLADVTGLPVRVGIEVDERQYIGRVYQVRVGQNPNSDGTRVETVMPVGNVAPPAAGNGQPTMATAQQTDEIKGLIRQVFGDQGPTAEQRSELLQSAGLPANIGKMTGVQAETLIAVLRRRLQPEPAGVGDANEGGNYSDIPF